MSRDLATLEQHALRGQARVHLLAFTGARPRVQRGDDPECCDRG